MDVVQPIEQSRGKEVVVPIDRLLAERRNVIRSLIPLVDPANASEYDELTRNAAAYVLGEFRAEEAVPVLTAALANPPGPHVSIGVPMRLMAAVHGALVKIGRPSIPALLDVIMTTDDGPYRDNAANVLLHILGRGPLMTLLVTLKERTEDENAHARLQAVHEHIDERYGDVDRLY